MGSLPTRKNGVRSAPTVSVCAKAYKSLAQLFRFCYIDCSQPTVMLKTTAYILVVLWMVSLPMRAASPLIISEFMAANDNSISDNDGDKSDWIEIYNGGTNTVSLLGWYLTDTTNNLRKWQFPAVSLLPNSYLL